MTIRKAAKELGIQVRTLREWIKLKKIRAEKCENGWYWDIPCSEVDRINADKRSKSTQ